MNPNKNGLSPLSGAHRLKNVRNFPTFIEALKGYWTLFHDYAGRNQATPWLFFTNHSAGCPDTLLV
jgi:hypothetical protein